MEWQASVRGNLVPCSRATHVPHLVVQKAGIHGFQSAGHHSEPLQTRGHCHLSAQAVQGGISHSPQASTPYGSSDSASADTVLVPASSLAAAATPPPPPPHLDGLLQFCQGGLQCAQQLVEAVQLLAQNHAQRVDLPYSIVEAYDVFGSPTNAGQAQQCRTGDLVGF